MKILIKPARNKQFVWEFVARNGKITANNETFATRQNAVRAAKAVVTQLFKALGIPGYVLFFSSSEGKEKDTLTLQPYANRKVNDDGLPLFP